MMKDQRGFTLVELVMAIAITGLIVSVLGTAIFQIVNVTGYGNDRMIATHELQNAAHWVCLDGQGASSASGGTELVLTLPDSSSITYRLEGTKLRRTADGLKMTLARNISSISFSVEDRTVTMEIVSTPRGRQGVVEQGVYRVHLRPAEG